MIFLLVYDRPKGCIVTRREFEDLARPLAEEARLEIELALGARMSTHEVVLLQAKNEAELRKTHARYFEDLGQLADRVRRDPSARRKGSSD